jgi:hypothetical protein
LEKNFVGLDLRGWFKRIDLKELVLFGILKKAIKKGEGGLWEHCAKYAQMNGSFL